MPRIVHPLTRQCTRCHTRRDRAELFAAGSEVCLLCVRRAEREADGMLHKSQRQVDAIDRQRVSPEERYRRQLLGAGYSDAVIDAYVASKFN